MDDQHHGPGGPSKPPAVPAHPSVLDSVVVYAEGAVCRRRATVPLPPGGRLRLTGLPAAVDGRSLRARVLAGPAGTAVTEARLELLAELREPDELPGLQRALDEAAERCGALAERLRLVEAAVAETAALRPVPPRRRRDEPLRRTPADAWLELADFVEARLSRLQQRAEELTRELELADHERALAADRLERASTAERAEPVGTGTTALLTLGTDGTDGTAPAADAATPTTGTAAPTTDTATPADGHPVLELELELEYGVPAARWVPAYRLSYRTGSDTADLVLRAAVAQRTGEDWTGVRLALSTADLDRRTDLPRLASLRIGRSQPAPPPSGWREPPAGLNDLFSGYDAAGADRPAPRPHPYAPAAAAGPVRAARVGGVRPGGPRAEAFAAEEHFAPAAPGPYGGGLLNADQPMPAPPGAPAAPGAAAPGAPAGFAGYGGPPLPPPVAAAPAPSQAKRGLPATEAQRHPAPPPPPGLAPDASLLDYPDLVLAGPEEPADRRGTLRPRLHHTHQPGYQALTAPGTDGTTRLRTLALPRHAVPPRESAGSFDHRFDAAAPADVPSDGTWHTVTVGGIPLTVAPEYVTVPAVEEKVYATLVLANRTDQAVLAGPAEVTVDGEFLLTAALPTLAPGGTRRLGIGVAESIEVARRTELHESTTGVLKGNSTVLDHRVHVRLANRLARAVTVEVRERVPVASDAEIRIEERADWHAPAVPAPDCPPSTRLWRVDLPPGGRTELAGGYLIRIPAGKAVVGGNRRN
ncbi:DUF4139 domain-containing protein [Kitasatospora sp. NPDC018619]|uniref:DUF4139 domain-containing protein n=1 Tax=unclassified Kitasatospora TaxID=2633591 RepID=UPI0037A1017C